MLFNTNKFLENSKRIHYKDVREKLKEFADINKSPDSKYASPLISTNSMERILKREISNDKKIFL